jgi:hypothetical protein
LSKHFTKNIQIAKKKKSPIVIEEVQSKSTIRLDTITIRYFYTNTRMDKFFKLIPSVSKDVEELELKPMGGNMK